MPKKLGALASKRAVDKQLARYRAMRDFLETAEPAGGSTAARRPTGSRKSALPFVVQKHAATRLHYDFRLGWNGVLKSWAVAKGPSYFPGDKRLAVEVEDHPIEYGGFEGTIPKGQYGGGTVMVWDQGTWEPLGDVDQSLKAGSLKFYLHGKKLLGKWTLIRMKGRGEPAPKPNWLLIKEHDQYERSADATPITEEEQNSVVTGRDLDAIAHDAGHVWNSNKDGNSGLGTDERAAGAAPGIRRGPPPEKKRPNFLAGISGAPKEPLPAFVAPQLAAQADSPPRGPGWLHELKLDGYRIQARIEHRDRNSVRLLTRTGLDWTHRMRALADALAHLPVESAVLDGEVVVLRGDGTTSFADLQAAFQEGAKHSLTYFIFDLLHLNGRNLRNLPLKIRKEILARMLEASSAGDKICFSDHLGADANRVFTKACELGAEGIVSKLASAKYSSGRSNSWLKLKCYKDQEMVVGGFTDLSNGRRGIGALLLGYYRSGKLIYAGRTGTGFTDKTHRMMRDRLDGLVRDASPFAEIPPGEGRGVHWVKPELVAQISFSNWTADNLMRQASFKGLREDKPAKEVHREDAVETPSAKPHGKAAAKAALRAAAPAQKSAGAAQSLIRAKKGDSAPAALPIRLTHPGRILDTESGVTKQALAQYYAAVADRMLPHVADRPLSIVRCPQGSIGACFFQKHVNGTLPAEIGSIDVIDRKSGKTEPYITISSANGLIALAQMSVLEVHPWGSRNSSLDQPDRIIFDLDPDAAIPWRTLASSAIEIRNRLRKLDLYSYLKSTGGKGLHVVAPIRVEYQWPEVKQFAHDLVLAMEKSNPALYISKMTKAARTGKIYLDYLRNDRGSTSVAPYSPRARSGMRVSMPLSWSELQSDEPPRFSVSSLPAWKHRLDHDPWKDWRSDQRLRVTARKTSA
jgi:bifunctional non-homologous end joining protein LigD